MGCMRCVLKEGGDGVVGDGADVWRWGWFGRGGGGVQGVWGGDAVDIVCGEAGWRAEVEGVLDVGSVGGVDGG